MEARGHGDGDRRGPAADLPRRASGRSWAAAHVRIERREALRVGGGPSSRRRRGSDSRRLRIHQGLRGGEVVQGPTRHGNLRRDLRGPAARHRAFDSRRLRTLKSPPYQNRSCDEPLCHRGFCGTMATRVLYMEERRGQDPDPCYAREFDARIVERGPDFVVLDQIHMDYSRVDFQPANFTADDLKRIEDECNGVVASAQDVRIFEEDRVVVHNKIEDRALLELIPQSVRRLRIIQIGNADYCPCGGTHLKNVSEIGRVRILEKRSKGKETDRIVYELLPE